MLDQDIPLEAVETPKQIKVSRDQVWSLNQFCSADFSQSHNVWFERDVRRIDFVVIFFQWTQNWTALNFEVNFQPLIQVN